MAFRASVYRVMIISPGDVDPERNLVEQGIIAWNDEHSEQQGVVYLPTRWERSSPRQGAAGQDILNEDLVDISDVGIAIFWEKVGTQTRISASGAVEEVERFAAAGKPHCVLFKKPSDPPPETEQYHELLAFKSRLHAHEGELVGLTKSFSNDALLHATVHRYLTDVLARLPEVAGDADLTLDQLRLLRAVIQRMAATDSPFVNTNELDDKAIEGFSGGRLQAALNELSRRGFVEIQRDLGNLGFAVTVTEEGILQGTQDLAQIEKRVRSDICARWETTALEVAERLDIPEQLVIAIVQRLHDQGLTNMLRGASAKIHRPTNELCGWDQVRSQKACLVIAGFGPITSKHGFNSVGVELRNEGEYPARDVKITIGSDSGFQNESDDPAIEVIYPGSTGRSGFPIRDPEKDETNSWIHAQQIVKLRVTFRDGVGRRDEAIFTVQLVSHAGIWQPTEVRNLAKLSPICYFARPEAQ